MKNCIRLLPIIFIMILICGSEVRECNGYMKPTHEILNETIVTKGYGYSLNYYLVTNLSISSGITQEFKKDGMSKRVVKWVGNGGMNEDEPNLVRNMHHFHDPLVEYWPNAGFKGVGISSAIWAQSLTQNRLTGTGSYSWHDAREYFHNALTASDENIRNENFADCFRGLGQQMHLVQDASVPSHTRDDFHRYYHYEHYVNDNNGLVLGIISNPSNIPVVDPAIFRIPDYQYTPSPTANLIDNNLYNGNNPEITIGMNAGLAEYANANFLSEDTIFLDYTFPSMSTSVVPVDNYIPDPRNPGNSVYRMYYYKTGDGDSDYPVAAINYFKNYHIRYVPWLDVDKIAYCYDGTLDRVCYEAYARRLLPRAVAYSSELLRYFFRGDIDAVNAKEVKDASSEVTGMTMKVKNATANEGMAGGGLVVSCRYKQADATEYTYTKSAEAAIS
ncbi:MAG: hypothetical protein HZC51_01585, partial [Nitrospirae bacterium]|nr:hypothetical protein [Nitrospirota bacterium]